jgi:AraC-like DNA-binding protein
MSQFSSTSRHAALPPVDDSPIRSILLARRFVFRQCSRIFRATSLPGHLLHLIVAGRVRQQCNGRQYVLGPGCVMWYHEDELVQTRLIRPPLVFYSVNFIAPSLPPPPHDQRMFSRRRALQPHFAALVRAWQNCVDTPLERTFRCHAALLEILRQLSPSRRIRGKMDPIARQWWEIETALRKDLSQNVPLDHMVRLSGMSASSIARACQHAVNMPPKRRMKQVRMSLARGLLGQRDLSVTAIARRLGYIRVHEFSRDFRAHFGMPPTSLRQVRSRGQEM